MFYFFATFISFRKKSQLNSTGVYYCVSVWTPALAQLPMPACVARLSMKSAVSHDTFFKIADNTVSDSDSSWEERADEGPINPIEEAKRLGANLATLENAKITRERKIQTNPAGKNSNKTNFKCNQVKK